MSVLLSLHPKHLRILPIQLHKFFMRACFNQAAIIEHNDPICHSCGRQPVADEDNRFISSVFQYGSIQFVFCYSRFA